MNNHGRHLQVESSWRLAYCPPLLPLPEDVSPHLFHHLAQSMILPPTASNCSYDVSSPSSGPLNLFTPSRSMCAGDNRHTCGAPCIRVLFSPLKGLTRSHTQHPCCENRKSGDGKKSATRGLISRVLKLQAWSPPTINYDCSGHSTRGRGIALACVRTSDRPRSTVCSVSCGS